MNESNKAPGEQCKIQYSNAGKTVQGTSESNSGLGAMQGQWAASKTGVEINKLN